MSDLRELYQEVILDHNKRPRNFGPLEGAARSASGYNPICGDEVTVHVALDDERLRDVHFEGSGCAISIASASLMTEAIKGKPLKEVDALFERFHQLVTSEEGDGDEIGKLAVMGGVRDYPMRVKCATLAWHTLRSALHEPERDAPVTTE